MPTLTFQEIREAAMRERGMANLTMDFREIHPFNQGNEPVPDQYVKCLGFKPLGEKWRGLERERALVKMEFVLHRDLAYGTPRMRRETARTLAEGFLALFDTTRCHYYTNDCSDGEQLSAWEPISESTFDRGVVVSDERHIGILWVQDED